eukprot:gene44030-49786_t
MCIGDSIADLEQQKRQAFERKDFSACKAIQARIAALKQQQA